MRSGKDILNLLEKNRKEMNRLGVKHVGLFGSYARGKQTKGSDIDLIVEFESGKKNLHNYMQLKYFLEKALDAKVDLVIKESIKPQLKQRILRSVVYAT